MSRDTTDQFSNLLQVSLYNCIDTVNNKLEILGVTVTNGEVNLDGLSEKLTACVDKTAYKLRVKVV